MPAKKKIAIMGASELQLPLIRKAKEMGIKTHVFAWEVGAPGETEADHFWPISLTERDEILKKCKKLKVNAVCSIASDLGNSTASYVANEMGLIYNSPETVEKSTNKILMRQCFERHGVASPKFVPMEYPCDCEIDLDTPFILKPADRSGSRGVSKITTSTQVLQALASAIESSFKRQAIAEEFIEGEEFSVECISHGGEHHFVALTKKFTTGEPNFIEIGHIEPARVREDVLEQIKAETTHALHALGVTEGPSHTELIVNDEGVWVVEVGTRMGGDCIGSNLVPLSTGYDFLEATIKLYLGLDFEEPAPGQVQAAAVVYFFEKSDLKIYEMLSQDPHVNVVAHSDFEFDGEAVVDSSSRKGFFICTCAERAHLYDILEGYERQASK